MRQSQENRRLKPRGIVLVFFAVMLVVIIGMMAFALDVGHIVLVRTQLQAAADAAAMVLHAFAPPASPPPPVWPDRFLFSPLRRSSLIPPALFARSIEKRRGHSCGIAHFRPPASGLNDAAQDR